MERGALSLLAAVMFVACDASPVDRSTVAIVDPTGLSDDAAVVAIVTWEPSCAAPARVVCSGVLVAPRVVLTAAHCVDDVARAEGAVFFGDDIAAPGTYVPIVEAVAHPDYDPDVRGYDIGVMRLASAAPVAPAPFGSAEALPVGAALRVVGFGVTSGDDATFATAGVRRTGTMSLTSIDATEVLSSPAPSNTCRIDSGGPVLADIDGGEMVVAITAGGDADCIESTRSIRVDAVRALLVDPFIASAMDAPARPPPDGLANLCEDECIDDDGCALSMSCQGTPTGRRCALRAVGPGSFGDACASDSECGGEPCIRIGGGGPGDCRCFTACGDGAMPPPADAGSGEPTMPGEEGGGSCSVRTARGSTLWLLFFVLWAGLLRHRRAARP